MKNGWREQLQPGQALREIVQQATLALVAMDADRLEELARCCADLNLDLQDPHLRAEAAEELWSSRRDLMLLDSILFETRANLSVFTALHQIRHRKTAQQIEMRRLRESESLFFSNLAVEKVEYGDD